ncbi:MAG: fatty acid desaturase [Gemmatimonadota bacterium]|nr:fatty acid desaturase [Gemmatimonadota bacterium]
MPGYGALSTPWWVPVVYVIALGHITNVCNTLYLHRNQTHGGVEFHPVVAHAMRFWLWLTTSIVTREWVAVHRKHHAFADREGDPHSPVVEGLAAIAFNGLFFYRKAARDPETLEKYGKGTPDDWIERHVYTGKRTLGLFIMLALDIWLFGWAVGLIVWSCMAIWIPIMGNIINGIGHALGYRTFETRDHSHNIYPWGMWIVGEELHNNHHADPRSAKFKANWWEFDIGWAYIRVLSLLRLANVIYARSVSAREFAARYYEERVASPVGERIERAIAALQAAKEEGLARIEHAREEGRARLESIRASGQARLENRIEHGQARLEHAREEGRARLENAREEGRARLESAQARLEQTREECLARIELRFEEARARIDRVKTEGRARLETLKLEATAELEGARAAARASVLALAPAAPPG